jgi:hypothetical protein
LLSEKEFESLQADMVIHLDGSTTVEYINTKDKPLADKWVGVLETVRFIPAMENGQPTETKVSLQLSSLID